MRSALALWAAVFSLVPSSKAANIRHSGGEHRTGLLRHSKLSDSANVDAVLSARAQKTRFGPGNCISTWRNEDGHCEVETHCKDADISKYPVKFICIDNGGEKVRHVFAVGSFDTEEQFDTLIECKQCLAEKEETISIIADVPPGSHGKKEKPEKVEDEESGDSPIKALKDEVKALEGFMMNTSAELQKLNAKVYNQNSAPSASAPPPVAAKIAFNHRKHHEEKSVVVQEQVVDPARLETQALRVKKEHRSRLADDEDVASLVKTVKKAEDTASSLAGALRTAEERDGSLPARQPAKAAMVLPKAAHKPKPKHLVVSLPKVHDTTDPESFDDYDGDGGDSSEEDSPIPQTADEFERQEEEDEQPSFSALQQHRDDGGEDDEGIADDQAQEDEDASQ